jgi:hypothetical protein
MATWPGRALAILICALAASLSLAAERTYDQRFNAPPGGQLTVTTDIGSVAVVGGNTRELLVHADMSGPSDFLDHLEVKAVQDSSGVTVTARVPRLVWYSWFGWFGLGRHHVRFTIDVPRDYPVYVRTSGGSVDVRNLTASLRGATSGGSIMVRDVAGPVSAHTSGGSIQAAGLNGRIELRTSGGSIGVTDSTGDLDVHTSGGGIHLQGIDGKVRAVTSGGSVTAEMRANRGVSLITSGGSIVLKLPASARASIDAHTTGGRAESAIPLSSTEVEVRNHLRGAINGGGEPVYLRTSGGSIEIEPL